MVTVPVETESVTPTSPGPVYQRADAPSADFGVAQADALKAAAPQLDSASNALGNVAIQQANRAASVGRATGMTAFSTTAQKQLQDWSTSSDLTDPKATGAFQAQMNDLAQQAIDQHTQQFGPNSGADFADQIAQAKTALITHANSLGFEAQNKAVGLALNTQLGPVLNAAFSGEGNDADLLARGQNAIRSAQPGLGTETAAEINNSFNQRFIQMRVQGMLDRSGSASDLDNVRNYISQNQSLMQPETFANVSAHVTAAATALAEKGMRGVNDPTSSINFIINNAAAYGAGQMTPTQDAQYEAAAQAVTKPHMVPNPQTGLMENVPGIDISQIGSVAAALAKRGTAIPGATGTSIPVPLPPPPPYPGAPMPGASAAPSTPTNATLAAAAQPRTMALPPQPQAPAAPAPSVAPAVAPVPTAPGGGDTIWQMADKGNVAGPVPAAMRMLRAIPGLGGAMPGAGATGAAADIPYVLARASSALSDANLAGSNRPSEASQEEIDKTLANLAPAKFDNKENYQENLVHLDDQLATQETVLRARAVDATQDPKVRGQADQLVSQIVGVRQSLGVPPKMTLEQVKAAPAGVVYRMPSGKVAVTKGRAN